MNKKTKNSLIGAAIGLVLGAIIDSDAIILFLLMGTGAGYFSTLENTKLKYILMGLCIGGPIGAVIGYFVWSSKYETPSKPEQKEVLQPETAPKEDEDVKIKREQLSAKEEQCQFCLAVWALAQASCWADGEKGEGENNEAKQILKALIENFPEEQRKSVALSLDQFNKNKPKPALNDAIVEIEKLKNPDYMILDSVVQRIVRSNNEISDTEQTFLTSWQQYMDSKR